MGRSDICGSFLGTTFTARQWLSLDPCGLCCVSLSFTIHAFALYVIPTRLISHSTVAVAIFVAVYGPASILALSSLLAAWTTNPGAVPMGARPLPLPTKLGGGGGLGDVENPSAAAAAAASANAMIGRRRGIRRCRKCNDNYKPPRAHHDSVTGRCIVKMDHFCPWVGNAVGALNHKFFFLFILYTFITSIVSLVLLFMRFARCGYVAEMAPSSHGESNVDNGHDSDSDLGNESDGQDQHEGEEKEEDGEGTLDPTLRRLMPMSLSMPTSLSTLLHRALFVREEVDLTFDNPGCEGLFTHPVLVLFVVSVAFLFFTCCMLTEQIDAIRSNTGKIARMKMRSGSADAAELGRVATDFNEMFGGGPGWWCGGGSGGSDGCGNGSRRRGGGGGWPEWHWFVPLPVRFTDGTHDDIMGYEYDPSWGSGPYQEPDEDDMDVDGEEGEEDSWVSGGGSKSKSGEGSKPKIVAGGGKAAKASLSAPPAAAKPALDHSADNDDESSSVAAADEFVQESSIMESSSEARVPARKAATATQARKRNKQESGDSERTVPSIV